MTDAAATAEPPPKSSRRWILIAFPLALLLGGGGFYATWSGLLAVPEIGASRGESAPEVSVAYVPLRELVVTVGARGNTSQLLFSADLEVDVANERAVAALTPRFIDVLNSYLRALEPEEIEHPAALVRLRAQMLRRMQIVAGEGMVRDLLIIEFVLR